MQIRPIKDLRNTNEISELCKTTGEPIYITKNGYGDMVIMSMSVWQKQTADIKLHKDLMEGYRQALNGEGRLGEEVFADIRAKYGFE